MGWVVAEADTSTQSTGTQHSAWQGHRCARKPLGFPLGHDLLLGKFAEPCVFGVPGQAGML